jgi:putative acyl-CoA dehydrogenase
MTNVLADLALESEAATALLLRLAGAVDRGGFDPNEAALARVGIALGKFWVCKRAIAQIAEAMECLGGNGYVEESILPRLYREAPVNAIWEGSGNVNALDLLRAISKNPQTQAAYFAELERATGANRTFDRALATLREATAPAENAHEAGARRTVEQMALALQASLLIRHAPPAVSDAFVAARLGAERGTGFGTLPPDAGARTILERAWPR